MSKAHKRILMYLKEMTENEIEDSGLAILMQQADRNDIVSRDEVFRELDTR